ncbi:SymE family type I addiction module toxin [Erwinia sp. 198]|uniref:SymE family type I addiction module toxin n=1 Tax=Erwinia sp. 198 TaxID=2022746 RepID=UPI001F3FC340|nr:SymE family type I addiction module toxin [Erwinia sp. 198]
MAETHHKPEHVSTKARRYTVGYIRDHIKHQPSPSITLRSHWMGDLGFEAGKKVEVLCEWGELIIRLAEE